VNVLPIGPPHFFCSNRAMCMLKLREWRKAERDAGLALGVDAGHVKSYMRRAAARNALGLHRAAMADLEAAREVDADGGQQRSPPPHRI